MMMEEKLESRSDSTFADLNGRRPETNGGSAEISLAGAAEASYGEFAASPPPELEILVGKDPDVALSEYGYPGRMVTRLGFRKSTVRRRKAPPPLRASTSSRKPKRTLPAEVESLTYEEVERILDDDGYTKRQIAELGFRRFGVPEKFLFYSRKDKAVMSIRDAIANRKLLDEISRQARKAGAARSA